MVPTILQCVARVRYTRLAWLAGTTALVAWAGLAAWAGLGGAWRWSLVLGLGAPWLAAWTTKHSLTSALGAVTAGTLFGGVIADLGTDCDVAWRGLRFAVAALPTWLLAAAVGLWARRLKRWQRTTAVAMPLIWSLLAAARLYATPSLTVTSPFLGRLSASVYDAEDLLTLSFGAQRMWTLVLALGMMALWLGLKPAKVVANSVVANGIAANRVAKNDAQRDASVASLGAALLVACAVSAFWAPELGWETPAERLVETRGLTLQEGRCIAHLPKELDRDVAFALAAQCEADIAAAESALGVEYGGPLTAFFFRSAGEKARLIGARGTYLAKPWRHEVYLQLDTLPHPVLRHEVTHVVAGVLARGPFDVAGVIGGLLPNPGLIEGLATMVAGETRSEHTSAEWAAAMARIGKLPRVDQLFSLNFFAGNTRGAYTAAAAFLDFLRQTRGIDTVRAVYRAGSLEAVLGNTVPKLEATWRKQLAAMTLPDGLVGRARVRFAAPSIVKARCPQAVSESRLALREAQRLHDWPAALTHAEGILAAQPNDVSAQLARTEAQLYLEPGRRIEVLDAIRTRYGNDSVVTWRAEERAADALWQSGEALAEAQTLYDVLLTRPLAPRVRQRIVAKREGVADPDAHVRRAFETYFFEADTGSDRSALKRLEAATTISTDRTDGIGPALKADVFREHALPGRAEAAQTTAEARGLP